MFELFKLCTKWKWLWIYICILQKCTLNLHQTYSKNKFDIPGIVSKPETPGLILAHGRVGESLYNGVQARVFISRDGGISWKQVCTKCITAGTFNILKGYADTLYCVLWFHWSMHCTNFQYKVLGTQILHYGISLVNF